MTQVQAGRGLPLAGLSVLVTRPRHQAGALSALLRGAGALAVELPVIEIVPVEQSELQQLLRNVADYDWLVFTSVNTVTVIAPQLVNQMPLPNIAAIGDATASALRDQGLKVDLVPETFVAESVVDALVERGVAGSRVLLPRAEVARDALPDGLRAAGATVDVVSVYQTRRARNVSPQVLASLQAGEIDVVTFTSPSTVTNLLELTGGTLPAVTRVACIGPVTAEAARDAGVRVDIVAETYTVPGLVEALIDNEGEFNE